MMKLTSVLKCAVMAISLAFSGIIRASDVAVSDSLLTLATNVTQNYTFTDPSNGLSVVVAVTMAPYSSRTASPAFTQLDFSNGRPIHLGADSGLGGGDGNWVDSFEGI